MFLYATQNFQVSHCEGETALDSKMSVKINKFLELNNVQELQSLFAKVHLLESSNDESQSGEKKINKKEILIIRNKDDLDLLNPSENIFLKIKKLDISVSELTQIPTKIFNFKYLTDLNLRNSLLQILPTEVGNLRNLVTLQLSGNNLKSLPKSLRHLKQLHFLDISHNNFIQIPYVLYFGLRALRILDVSHNSISTFNDPPACLNRLIVLNISSNALTELPLWVLNMFCYLQSLDVSKNEMYFNKQCFSTGFEIFNSIQVLNMENCNYNSENITVLSVFKNLKVLHLGNEEFSAKQRMGKNYFGNFSVDSLKGLRCIKCLYLQNVRLGTLPLDFGSLQSLSLLDLSENLLSWLPESFCDLTSLRILYLTSNKLLFLPRNIWKLVNLEQIHLGSNEITEIPEEFYNLEKLEFVDLYNNKIEAIEAKLFKLKNLKGVDVGLNRLDFSPDSSLGEVSSAYKPLRDYFRKFFGISDCRSDSQVTPPSSPPVASNSQSCSSKSSLSSFDSDECSLLEEALVQSRTEFKEENWDKIPTDVEEDELFNPDENHFRRLFEGDWRSNNYCPGNVQVPSVLKNYARIAKLNTNKENSVEGQFDSE